MVGGLSERADVLGEPAALQGFQSAREVLRGCGPPQQQADPGVPGQGVVRPVEGVVHLQRAVQVLSRGPDHLGGVARCLVHRLGGGGRLEPGRIDSSLGRVLHLGGEGVGIGLCGGVHGADLLPRGRCGTGGCVPYASLSLLQGVGELPHRRGDPLQGRLALRDGGGHPAGERGVGVGRRALPAGRGQDVTGRTTAARSQVAHAGCPGRELPGQGAQLARRAGRDGEPLGRHRAPPSSADSRWPCASSTAR